MPLVPFVLGSGAACAQDTLHATSFARRPETGILVGHSKEIGSKNHAPIHFAELGVVRGAAGGRHMDSWSYQASTLFGLSGSTPILAPRIGAQAAMLISFGVELAKKPSQHYPSDCARVFRDYPALLNPYRAPGYARVSRLGWSRDPSGSLPKAILRWLQLHGSGDRQSRARAEHRIHRLSTEHRLEAERVPHRHRLQARRRRMPERDLPARAVP